MYILLFVIYFIVKFSKILEINYEQYLIDISIKI